MSIFFAELIGSFMLILLGNGVTACAVLPKSKGENGGWIVITAGWGFAVTFSVYLVGWVSGAHINPAVTIAMLLAEKIPLMQLPQYILGQFLGMMLGAYAVFTFYKEHFFSSKDAAAKLCSFCTKPSILEKKSNLFSETVATFVLIMGVFSLIDAHNNIPNYLQPALIGFLVFSIGLSLGGTTGYAINPFRDLSPRIIHQLVSFPQKGSSEWSYAWIPFFGPIVGSFLAYLFYFKIFLAIS